MICKVCNTNQAMFSFNKACLYAIHNLNCSLTRDLIPICWDCLEKEAVLRRLEDGYLFMCNPCTNFYRTTIADLKEKLWKK